MRPLVDAKTAQEVAAEAKQIVQDAIKDAERATGVTHEQFRQSMEVIWVKPSSGVFDAPEEKAR